MRKRIIFVVMVFMMMLMTTNAFALSPAYISSVEIDAEDHIELEVGETIELTANANPEGFDYVYMEWVLDNPDIVTIKGTSYGTVLTPPTETIEISAVSCGTVTVTVYASYWVGEHEVEDSITITVAESVPDATPAPTPTPGPTAVPEGTELTDGDYTYIITDGEATITDVNRLMTGVVEIPSVLGGCPVAAIGDEAFYMASYIERIVIPDGVRTIGESAFKDCQDMKKITIPDSVESIGEYAFAWCFDLSSVKLPSGLKRIEASTFYTCPGLQGVTIPLSVESIGGNAFFDCNGLLDVMYEGCKTDWHKISIEANNGVLLNATMFYGTSSSVNDTAMPEDYYTYSISEGNATITACSGNLKGKVEIPQMLADYPVNAIGYSAFYGNQDLTEVIFPEGMTSIGVMAFEDCVNIKSITIPETVTTIERRAFSNCDSLTSVDIPDGITVIDEKVFRACDGLSSVNIPKNVESIGSQAFYGCSNLKDVYYDGGKNGWENIQIDSYNEPLENAIFHYALIKDNEYTYTLSNGEVTITGCEDDLYDDVVLPSEIDGYPVTAIGEKAFSAEDEITSVVIPDSVKSIGDYAFGWCSGLVSVDLPDGLINIGEAAFLNCNSLRDVTFPNGVKSIGARAFSHCAISKLVLPEGLKEIEPETFYYCFALTDVTVPASMTDIDKNAFYGCGGLSDVYYMGMEDEWDMINIDLSNTSLLNATLHCTYEIVVNETMSGAVSVTFNAEDIADVVWYIAVYDGEGRIKEINGGAVENVGTTVTTEIPDDKCVKAFMWRKMTPIVSKVLSK